MLRAAWLDQRDLLRTAVLAGNQNRLDRLNATMKLYQALGGPDLWTDQVPASSTP